MKIIGDGISGIDVVEYEYSDVFNGVSVPPGGSVLSGTGIMIHHLEYPTINFDWPLPPASNSIDVSLVAVNSPQGQIISASLLGTFNPVALFVSFIAGYSVSLRPLGLEQNFYPYSRILVANNDVVAQTINAKIHGVTK